MNLLRLSWKNLGFKPLNTALSLILFALGVGLISLLFLLENQIQQNFEKNLAKVDLVIGAKGSPLQMILSSMYHIDAPTGNIPIKGIRPFLNPKHPLIAAALPLSLGDSYRGYRIVGTTTDILDWYGVSLNDGALFRSNFDVVIGHSVAVNLKLSIGDAFKSSHGLADAQGLEHDDAHDFRVTGILAPSGTIVDALILTTPQTYWSVHDHEEAASESESEEDSNDEGHDHEEDGHEHDADGDDHDEEQEAHGDDEAHDHDSDHSAEQKPLIEEDGEKSITNLLLRFKGRSFQALNMQRSINENTDMQAATPAIEINRLFSMMNDAEQALRILALVIILVSGLSIFIALYSSLRERKYELSLMRVMGGSKKTIFSLIIFEGLLLSVIGYLIGIFLSHVGMSIIGTILRNDYRYEFSGLILLPQELWLLLGALVLGFVASLLPAIQASRTDISETLSRG